MWLGCHRGRHEEETLWDIGFFLLFFAFETVHGQNRTGQLGSLGCAGDLFCNNCHNDNDNEIEWFFFSSSAQDKLFV